MSRLFNLLMRMAMRMMPGGCFHVRKLSSEYIDGDRDETRTAKVRSHLERCGPCNAFFNTLRATVGLLRNIPKQEPPGDFRDRIRENIRKESRQ